MAEVLARTNRWGGPLAPTGFARRARTRSPTHARAWLHTVPDPISGRVQFAIGPATAQSPGRATHGPLLIQIPSMRKYIQSHVMPDPAQADTQCDGVAEIWFDSPEAFQEALASPQGQTAMADLPNFCDTAKVHIFAVEEVPLV